MVSGGESGVEYHESSDGMADGEEFLFLVLVLGDEIKEMLRRVHVAERASNPPSVSVSERGTLRVGEARARVVLDSSK